MSLPGFTAFIRSAASALLALTACALTPTTAPAQTAISVRLDEPRQLIDGFGASSAWTAQAITDAQADLFFSPTTGLGLSLLRVRIAPSGNTWETTTAQKAVARGARVWATPWSPPGAWKTNGTDNNGGSLLPEYQDDWAARLAQFVVNMRAVGVPILALSAQNEPNWTADWETCRWTPAELTAFVRDHLGPALVARGVTTRVLAPESIDWYSIANYADSLLGDAAARAFVSHVATHSYGGTAFAYAAPAAAGLPFWQTEYSDNGATADPTIASGLRVAGVIHDFLTVAQGSAWHYWWMYPSTAGGSSTGALVEADAMTKRGWALGNWARFVRPGHRRVNTTGSTSTLRVTAFAAPDAGRLSIVVVNSSTSARPLTITLAAGAVSALTPWETSATRSLAALTAIPANANGTFSATVPAQSITTFVAESLAPPPSVITLTTAAVTENAPAGTPVGRPVIDPAPATGVSYTFAFASGAGDTDNALFTLSGGFVRTAAPLDYEASSTRSIRLRATDSSTGAIIEQALVITVVNRTDEYADWSSVLPADARATAADPDGDGLPNLLAYALGFPADLATGSTPPNARPGLARAADGALRFGFTLAASAPPDARYVIERTTDFTTWAALAAKSGAAAWTGPAPVLVEPAESGRVRASVADDGTDARRFYRLRVTLPD